MIHRMFFRSLGLAFLLGLVFAIPSTFGATYTVDDLTDSADDGECVTDTTIRDAIACALANSGADVIDFSGSGTITFTDWAPGISDTAGLTIDGGTDIVFDGDSQTYQAITISGDNVQMKGLTFKNFDGTELYVNGDNNTIGGPLAADRNYFVRDVGGTAGNSIYVEGTGNTIQNNYIGVKSDGDTSADRQSGIAIGGTSDNTTIEDNVITADNYCSITWGGTLGDVTVVGNNIGLNADGDTGFSSGSGICDTPAVGGPSETYSGSITIGGDTGVDATARNIISGSGVGILLKSDYTGGMKIQGNYIGTDVTGASAVAGWNGISMQNLSCSGGDGCFIGGDTAGKRNVISGNSNHGIYFHGSGNTGWQVQNNYIGLNASGADLGNGGDGINIVSTGTDITIGAVGYPNIISGNNDNGIETNGATGDITIISNYIGTNPAGTSAIANGSGVLMNNTDCTSTTCIIGGDAAGEGNIISGNTNSGIAPCVEATGWDIQGNYIGLGSDGSDVGNGGQGIAVDDAHDITIGDTTANNIISGNGGSGIVVQGTSSGISVLNNYIGTNVAGTSAIANDASGIYLGNAASESLDSIVIGETGATPSTNVISGNTGRGIWINDAKGDITVNGNYIGLNAAGTAAIANGGEGVEVNGSTEALTLTFGNTSATTPTNVISGNTTDGIEIIGSNAFLTGYIYSTMVGLNAAGTSAVANGDDGIYTDDPVTIGFNSLTAGFNVVSGNTGDGIEVGGSGTTGTISGNLIGTNLAGDAAVANGGDGIEIAGLGSTGITIGKSDSATATNVISGNTGYGIVLGEGGDGNAIYSSYIGSNKTAAGVLANGSGAIHIFNVLNTVVGNTTSAGFNIFAGDGTDNAISTTRNNDEFNYATIKGNYIGTGTAGTEDFGFANGIAGSGQNMTIGATTSGEGNEFANCSNGISVGAATTGNMWKGNNFHDNTEDIYIETEGAMAISGTSITTSTTTEVSGTTNFADGVTMDVYSRADATSATVYEGSDTVASGAFAVYMDFAGTNGELYTVIATDASNNSSEFSGTAVITTDSTPPTTPVVTSSTADTTNASYTFEGTKEAYSSIFEGGVEFVALDSSTSWSKGTTLSEGVNAFSFTSKDYEPNTSGALVVNITLDTTAPDAPTITSSTSIIDTTSTKAHTITGTKEAGSSINEDGSEVVAADAETTWSYEVVLSQGVNNYSFTALDALLNESDATALAVTYTQDADAPSPPEITSSIADTATAAYTFEGTKEANSSIWEDGVEVVSLDAETTWSRPVTLVEGANAFSFTSKDALANESSATLTSITLDTTAPTAPTITSSTADTNNESYTFTGTKDASTSIWEDGVLVVALDGATSWSWVTTLTTEGANAFSFASKDALANESSTVESSITLDTTAPTAPAMTSVTSVTDNTVTKSHTITGTKDAGSSILENEVEVVEADAETTWSYEVVLVQGANPYSFTSEDAVGNTSIATVHSVIYIQIEVPVVTSDTTTSISGFTITGTKLADASINETSVEVVAADSLTTWSYTVNLAEGANAFSFTQVNAALVESEAAGYTVTYTPAADAALDYVGGGSGSSGSSAPPASSTGDDDDDDDDDDDVSIITGDDYASGDDDDDDDDDASIVTGDDDDDDDASIVTGDDDDDDDDDEVIREIIEEIEELYPAAEVIIEPVEATPVDTWTSPTTITTESVVQPVVTIETATIVDLIQNEQAAEIYENEDEDTISDDWEVYYFDSTESVDEEADSDRDGLTNAEEFALKTDPTNDDTDNDGVPDGLEQSTGTGLSDWDTDSDGLSDALELILGSDALNADSDGDGFEDGEEYYSDGDATSDASTPQDTDSDGAPDFWEEIYNVTTHNYGETVLVEDANREIKLTFAMTDSDGDGLSDAEELKYGTDPLDADTDRDGESDGAEVHEYKTNPRADTSTDLFYVTRLSNLNETEINTFADSRPLLRGVSEPSKEITIYMIPQEWLGAKKARFAFARMLMASLFGSDSDVITYETTTDEGGKFLARPDAADGDYLVFARSEEGAESVLYKMTVDTRTGVDWVNPEQLDTESIDVENLRMISIENSRPYLYGTAKEGYEVVASWASELHTSSLIMDSEEGEFITLAPAELEDGDHDLYVYAHDPLKNLYSSVIEIDFNVLAGRLYESAQEDSTTRMGLFLYGFGGVFVMIVFWMIVRSRKQKSN